MDEGNPIHYMAVPRGTPVYGSDGVEVGRVIEMLDNSRENIFDGVVFKGGDGRSRFADAPEVARTAGTGRHPDDRLGRGRRARSSREAEPPRTAKAAQADVETAEESA